MTVKELIEILQTKNQNAKVKYLYDGPDTLQFLLVTKVEDLYNEEIVLQ